MKFEALAIAGAWLIEPQPAADERGFFARTFEREAFASRGLETHVEQTSLSFNARAGTLRGMHYQAEPHGETKLVSCVCGAIFDVLLDLRPESPTFRKWVSVRLDDVRRASVYIPRGVAHGFQTLVDASLVSYVMSTPFVPEAARGVRFDDPAFGIEWPQVEHRVMSTRDRTYPLA